MRTLLVGLAALGALGFAGCGGSAAKPSAPLDCAYLESSANCWRSVASAALSCLPGSSEIGTLSADRSTCSFASGDTVTFTPPLPAPTTAAVPVQWNFTVTTSSGAACLSFNQRTDGTMTLTVQGDTVTVTDIGAKGLALTCPDGTTYANPAGLMSCADASLYSLLPAYGSALSSATAYFALTGATGADTEEAIFTCQMASP
jgi:hypothetical protein